MIFSNEKKLTKFFFLHQNFFRRDDDFFRCYSRKQILSQDLAAAQEHDQRRDVCNAFHETTNIPAPAAPGLGIEVDEALARAHPYTGDGLHLQMQEDPPRYDGPHLFEGGAPVKDS